MSRDEEQQIPHRRPRHGRGGHGSTSDRLQLQLAAPWPEHLALRRELGYVCHVDYVSRDEPFIELVTARTSLSCLTPSQ